MSLLRRASSLHAPTSLAARELPLLSLTHSTISYLGITLRMPQIEITHSDLSVAERRSKLARWFDARGFILSVFDKGTLRVSTYRMEELIVFKLSERSGYQTFYKESSEGALLVFEVSVSEESISYDGYCPLLLFGIWSKKLAFKQGASGLFKYRDEGYRIEQQFVEMLHQL